MGAFLWDDRDQDQESISDPRSLGWIMVDQKNR